MAIKITWRPVLQALMLKDYHPDYGDERIMVCVNPQPEFWRERTQLLAEYARLYGEVDLLNQRATNALGDERTGLEIHAGSKASEFLLWMETTFLPAVNAWFAKLWSFGDDQYTLEDLSEFHRVDEHFLTWLKARSIEMVEAHASARKKV